MKKAITTRTVTYLNYSLSQEEKEILAKSSNILGQVFDAIEKCTNIDINDEHDLVTYLSRTFNVDVDDYTYTICGIIDCIMHNSNTDFIAQQDWQDE